MYDFLIAADLMVPDPDGHAELLVEKLGVHSHPRWRQAPESMKSGLDSTHNYIAHFLRVNKSLAQAPTRLEPQHHWDVPNAVDPSFGAHLRSLEEFQGVHRPIKTHSITVAYNDIENLLERLVSRRLPFRVAPRDEVLWFARVWTGITPEDPVYRGAVDGGLSIEFHSGVPLQLPAEAYTEPYPEPVDPAPGEMIRITARANLVRDLDSTLGTLAANLDWEPIGPVEVFPEEGIRRARLGFRLAHSATIDLIEPTRWACETGQYLHTYGPGPYYIRIAVNGLDAKADDLRNRGTRFSWLPESPAAGGRRIQIDPAELAGTLIEFVEWVPR
ncbi:VOC family protein [Parafrankia elaeagni]|uniref:lactoylglutathione lyase n=1 Tax=Parafrankia elaeagni TaxID=222534 RepID=UPI0003A44B66|nr:lactoylglutathione lyase [Parafrankia elaeagni]